MDQTDGRVDLLATAATAGARRAHEAFRTVLDVETKAGPLDAVTEVDRAVQREATARIESSFPDDAVVGEEGDARETVPAEGWAWVIDPIDGTNNYVRGNRRWATSLALVRDGATVAGVNACPALGDRYAAVGSTADPTRNDEPIVPSDRADAGTFTVAPLLPATHPDLGPLAAAIATDLGDLRRVGSAQCALSMVAAGELDAAVTTAAVSPWDAVAGVHLLRRAGGTATDPRGERWRPGATGLVASNGRAHDAVVDVVAAVADGSRSPRGDR